MAVDGAGDATAQRARAAGADRRARAARAAGRSARRTRRSRGARRAARLQRRQRAVGARRAARARRAVRRPAGRLRLRAGRRSSTRPAPTRRACTGATRCGCARRSRALASVTGGNGAIYAVRREAYVEVDPIMGHDLSFPFKMVKHGRRAVYQPSARATEKMVPVDRGRVAAQAADDVPRLADRGPGRAADPRGYPPLYALMIVSPPAAALRHAVPARPDGARHARAAAPRPRLPARGRRPGRARRRGVLRHAREARARRPLLRPHHRRARRRACTTGCATARPPAGTRRRARGEPLPALAPQARARPRGRRPLALLSAPVVALAALAVRLESPRPPDLPPAPRRQGRARLRGAQAAHDGLRRRAHGRRAWRSTRATRGSRASARSCAARRSTSCRTWSTCCAARCR